MQTLWAKSALLADGWHESVRVEIDADGRIEALVPDCTPTGTRLGILLPAPGNVHSHGFQRAMAGLTERRGPDPRDTFWTWRQLMFRFLDQLTPEDVEAITGFVQMEMLEAGFASVGEFHYLHHQPGGRPYDDLAEMSGRIAAATAATGIGLTLLPVLYQQGGCDGRSLSPGQVRFGNDPAGFARLVEGARAACQTLPADTGFGIAPHSLRAVSKDGLTAAITLAGAGPLHMHLAEQVDEVIEIKEHYGARPVEWLLTHAEVGQNWCLIHATQMQPAETLALAGTRAVAGLCPITEASLGDGIFDGVRYLGAKGRIAIGSDSNIRISLAEELRQLEYSQRLRDKGRAVLASASQSTGRRLFEAISRGAAQALGRGSGVLEVGAWADLLALDGEATDLIGRSRDTVLDSFLTTGDQRMIDGVWSAGRHLVRSGAHIRRAEITKNYRATMQRLRDVM